VAGDADPHAAGQREGRRTRRGRAGRWGPLAPGGALLLWTATPDGAAKDLAAWRAFTGQSAEAARGRGWLDAIHPDDRPAVSAAWERAVAACAPFEAEFRVRRADGDARHVLARAMPALADDGTVREWVGFCADITARAQAEAATREGEARARALLDAAPDLLFRFARNGTIRDYQSRSTGNLYAPPTAFLGRQIGEVMPPEVAALTLRAIEDALATGEVQSFDYRLPLGDEEGAYEARVVASGPDEVLAAVRDITARFKTEVRQRFLAEIGALLAGSLDYEATLASVARLCVPTLADWAALDLTDERGRVRRLALAHRDPEREPALREMSRRYPPAAAAPSPVHDVLETGRSLFMPAMGPEQVRALVRDDEHLRLVEIVGMSAGMVVLLQARGRALGALSLVGTGTRRYTTEDLALAEEVGRRAALALDNAALYREARAAILEREQFASIASHELKTPLTTAQGYVDLLTRLLGRPEIDRERAGRYLGQLRTGLFRLGVLVADLLDVSRLQQGHLALRPAPFDLATLAREVLERFADAPERTDRHILTLEAGSPVTGEWDRDRLDQVVTNLVSNALKYSPDGGEVRVRAARSADGGAELAVTDAGVGIPPEVQPTLFRPFVRGAAASSAVGGTGLGLYIVDQIVRLHGGTVSLDSAPGAGTTMTVHLPARVPTPATPATGQ
jgi:PAS domain S-box-containing protein